MKLDWIRVSLGLAGIVALSLCLGSSIAFFRGSIDTDSFKRLFSIASIMWFVVAAAYAGRGHRSS